MKFRLQRVLDFRRQREEEMRQRLGAATRARVQAEAELHARIVAQEALRDSLARLLSGGRVDAARVQEMGALLEVAARAIDAQREEVGRRLAFESEERGRLATAMSERKALDRLRERHDERERREELRREAVMLDEIATARAVRGGAGPHPQAPLPILGEGSRSYTARHCAPDLPLPSQGHPRGYRGPCRPSRGLGG